MKKTRFLLLLLLPFWLAPALADEPLPKGLLWQITPPHGSPSYLLGTIHSEDPRILALTPKLREILDEIDSLSVEILPTPQNMMDAAELLMLPEGEKLATIIGPTRFFQIFTLLGDKGVPFDMASRLKPWAAALLLSYPNPQGEDILDFHLVKYVQKRDETNVHGLEEVEEQLTVFHQLSRADQIAMLDSTLDQIEQIPDFLDRMHALYLARDLNELQAFAKELMEYEDHPELSARLRDALLDQRNLRMLKRMVPRLAEGNALIAVGAMHLPGEAGLLSLLRQQGYRLEPLE